MASRFMSLIYLLIKAIWDLTINHCLTTRYNHLLNQMFYTILYKLLWKIMFTIIALVRKHYISKGVRKFKQRWKNKNYFVPWGGKISCLKKTEIVCKIECKIEGDKRGATLLSYSDLIFWVIRVGFDILQFFGLNLSNMQTEIVYLFQFSFYNLFKKISFFDVYGSWYLGF